MHTLYDVLGARPEDTAETLTKAFRKAAMASHPDLNRSDVDTIARFTEVTDAYHVLRDAGQRAVYDEELAVERKILRAAAWRSAMSFGARAAAMVVIGVALGYAWWIGVPQTIFSAVTEARATVGAAGPVRAAAPDLGVGGAQMPIVVAMPANDEADRAQPGQGDRRDDTTARDAHLQAPESDGAAPPVAHSPGRPDTAVEPAPGQIIDSGS